MTEKEIAVKCYLENIKEAKTKYITLYEENYKELAIQSIEQAQVFLKTYKGAIIPDDILNIP